MGYNKYIGFLRAEVYEDVCLTWVLQGIILESLMNMKGNLELVRKLMNSLLSIGVTRFFTNRVNEQRICKIKRIYQNNFF